MNKGTGMRGRFGFMVCTVVLGCLTLLGSCRPPEFPSGLFTITAEGADFPVMLSQTPPGAGGRKIQAASGTHNAASTSGYVGGRTTVYVTNIQQGQSELPASVQLNAQVLRADKWLQVDGAEFHSEDFATYGASRSVRRLTIAGTAYR